MERLRLIAAGLIFLILTAVKFFLPGTFENVQQAVGKFIDRDFDYISAFARITDAAGEIISTEEREYEFPTLSENEGKSSGALPTADKLRRVIYIGEEGGLSASAEKTESAEVPAVEAAIDDATEAEREDARVADFLRSQEAFAEYGVPENVSYALEELPFDYVSPVSGCLSSGFGYRDHPIMGGVRFHYGTDFAASSGEEVLAFASGRVLQASTSDSYGNYVVISHSDGFQTLYAHCSSLLVSAGDEVSRGDVIALVGATGLATGPHLHLELSRDGIYLNPEYYVNS